MKCLMCKSGKSSDQHFLRCEQMPNVLGRHSPMYSGVDLCLISPFSHNCSSVREDTESDILLSGVKLKKKKVIQSCIR